MLNGFEVIWRIKFCDEFLDLSYSDTVIKYNHLPLSADALIPVSDDLCSKTNHTISSISVTTKHVKTFKS